METKSKIFLTLMVSVLLVGLSSFWPANVTQAQPDSSDAKLLAITCTTSNSCVGNRLRQRLSNCKTVYTDCTYGCSNGACNSAPPPACTPVDATWSGWTDSTTCTVSCGGGTKTQTRTCSGASCGGSTSCSGSSTQTVDCNTQACAPPACVDNGTTCNYATSCATAGTNNCGQLVSRCNRTTRVDGGWSDCSVSCGGGTRTCTNPTPTCGGSTCSGSTSCNTQACVVPFNYSLSNSGNITSVKGSSGSNTITVTKTAGTAAAVTLSASQEYESLPTGVTAAFDPTSCSPEPTENSCTSTLTLTAGSTATVGTYTIKVSGSLLNKTTVFTLTVNEPPPVTPANMRVTTATPIVRGTTVNFAWDASVGATYYLVQFFRDSVGTGTWVYPSPTITTTNISYTDTANLNTIGALVMACKGAGNCSAVVGATATLTAPTVSTVLTPSPATGTGNTSVTLSATAGGTAIGPINYNFWWNCSNTSTSVATASGACGALTTPGAGACSANANGYKCNGVTANPKITSSHTYIPGSYTSKVIVERASISAENRQTVTIATPFTYTLSRSSASVTSIKGGTSGSNTITVSKTDGTAAAVTLSASQVSGSLPTGVTAAFNPTSCTPNATAPTTCTSTLTLTAGSTATVGTYTIQVSGSPSSGTTSFSLVVDAPPVTPANLRVTTATPIVRGTTVNFAWDSSAGATYYLVQFYPDGTLTGTWVSPSPLTATNLSYSSTGSLTSLDAVVKACKGTGNCSPATSVVTATLVAATATNSSTPISASDSDQNVVLNSSNNNIVYYRIDPDSAVDRLFRLRVAGAGVAVDVVDQNGNSDGNQVVTVAASTDIIVRVAQSQTRYLKFTGPNGSYSYTFKRFRNFPFYEGQ